MKAIVLISAAVLALSACSGGSPASKSGAASTEAAPAASASLRLYIMDCGHFDVSDLASFDRGHAYDGQAGELVDTCYLFRHPKGDFLWDTGIPDAVHDVEGGVTTGPFHITMPKTLIGQLAEIGLAPADIEYLSISHSHFDHVGNAGAFAASTFIINEPERAYMFRDEARADADTFPAYAALEHAKTITYKDEYDVFGDGSVKIIFAPGHTPGHAFLLANLPKSGPILLSGDLYHMTQAREKKTIPTFNTDADQTLASMAKFEALAAKTGARVVIQHEPADFARLPHAPDYLD